MAYRKKPELTEFLPSTPCTPEMREKMVTAAQKSNTSLAEIQRRAFSLFLRRIDRETINDETKPNIHKRETIGA